MLEAEHSMGTRWHASIILLYEMIWTLADVAWWHRGWGDGARGIVMSPDFCVLLAGYGSETQFAYTKCS